MQDWIALLRGINVGGTGKLPMAELRTLADDLGWRNVASYIQSGNLVFSAEGAARNLADELMHTVDHAKGFAPRVMVRSGDWLNQTLADVPFQANDPARLLIYTLESPPEAPELDLLSSLATASEAFLLKGDVFYLFAPDGIGRSKLAERVERALGVPATARNLKTLTKLAGMLGAQ